MRQQSTKKDLDNSLAFIKEVAKYFMDFLETDFHRRRIPKRSIKLHNSDNLLIGINLDKYEGFKKTVWGSINSTFDKNKLRKISKGVYKTSVPKNLLDLVKLQSERISQNDIKQVLDKVKNEIERTSVLYKAEFNKALNISLEESSKIIRELLVLPLIKSVEKSFYEMDIGDENTIYLMEEELTSILLRLVEDKISELLKLKIAKEQVNPEEELKKGLTLNNVKNQTSNFFESLRVKDLFAEIYELQRNRNILDKQELYLYFCDISFDKVKYPIFYIPFEIDKTGSAFQVNFDSQVYINKKALEYIAQEYNKEKGKKGTLKTINERILYLAQHQEDFKEIIKNILDEVSNFFDLDSTVDISESADQIARSRLVRISNTCYISLFDRSDEALVNDYEEILDLLKAGDSVLAKAFEKLIDDFIHNEPISFKEEVNDEWDELETPNKLVFSSPIPLNEEQRKILKAISKENCRYVTVEGPPGTGKSHTITAIAFNAILKNKSILVLSDKKEALDVVEDKITSTMNKVRRGDNFQNPILRLGRTGSTYSQILSASSIKNIEDSYRAIKKDYKLLKANIKGIKNSLREDIQAEIVSNENIDIKEVFELLGLEDYVNKNIDYLDFHELFNRENSSIEISELRNIFLKFKQFFTNITAPEANSGYAIINSYKLAGFKDFYSLVDFLLEIIGIKDKTISVFGNKIELLKITKDFDMRSLEKIVEFLKKYKKLKMPILGYLLRKNQVKQLNKEFRKNLPELPFKEPHNSIGDMENLMEICEYIKQYRQAGSLKNESKVNQDQCTTLVHKIITNESFNELVLNTIKLREDLEYLEKTFENYPNNKKKMGIRDNNFQSLFNNKLVQQPESDFEKLIRYIDLKQKIEKDFRNIPDINYQAQKQNLEDILTTQMTYLMDKRVISFYENSRSTAKTLREIIKSKSKFPKNEFAKLKNSFPCILAGIRDYAEYIPLEPEIFDLVIIDEASQVSIAQAFPALLRAKKVLVFGDRRQFSNVKAAQARTETNQEYLNNLDTNFKKNISKDLAKLKKLEKFNIKTSILEFLEFISNFNIMLQKHFRGYKEIISYSNKYFYQDGLQVMKIRGKPIDEVLKFNVLKHDRKSELIPNTNRVEAGFIMSELRKLKDNESKLNVGIVTPHTNQQKILMELISNMPERDTFFEDMKLKIMTFDTCQGEERDIVFYSMVATEEDDKLWAIFIKDLSRVDLEENGQIRAQRLNVGFSRAKECIYLITSKPFENFSGSIRDALIHYKGVLDMAKKEPLPDKLDPKSPMEKKVLNWLTQTEFYKNNQQKIEIKPQFNLGKYLKQLDTYYDHPEYTVDFLVIYNDLTKIHKIIMEYDGFEYHFRNLDNVASFNYEKYYSEEDIYRQKVLESYGYKFIRINRFNVGSNPIDSLDKRINTLLQERPFKNQIISGIHRTYDGLQSGEMKVCPKCREVRSQEDFKDSSLITGYGRFCSYCKGLASKQYSFSDVSSQETPRCPNCNSKMIPRTGRYGRFYGCSRFPYCRGTRPLN